MFVSHLKTLDVHIHYILRHSYSTISVLRTDLQNIFKISSSLSNQFYSLARERRVSRNLSVLKQFLINFDHGGILIYLQIDKCSYRVV